jgi:hypothetical protein
MRKGMMKGSGKRGYHNIIGKDPMVHSQSAKGIKQPQKVPMVHERKKLPKLTDYDLYFEGLLKKQDTWWYKKALEYSKELESTPSIKIHRKFENTDGWMDGISFPAYIVEFNNELYEVVCTESGCIIQKGNHIGTQFLSLVKR